MIRYLDVHQSLFLGPLRLAAYVLLLGCILLGLSYSSTAHAGELVLSNHNKISSQEDPNGVPFADPIVIEDLGATLVFTIFDPNTLLLFVRNDTGGDELFDINEVFFNASSNVTGLVYESADHSTNASDQQTFSAWVFEADDGGMMANITNADGFGLHDFALLDGTGPSNFDIGPDESITFEFTILGTGPFTMDDFTTTLSRFPGSHYRPTLAAAKFVRRRDSSGNQTQGQIDNSSAFGGNVPEPGSAMLLALGALSLLGYRGRCALL